MIYMKLIPNVSTWLFVVSAALVIGGYQLQKWALSVDNQLWINLSPDFMGAGLLVFVGSIVMFLFGNGKRK